MTMQHTAMGDVIPRSGALKSWERVRNRSAVYSLVEFLAESLGTFIYTYAGVGSTAAFVLGNILEQPGLGSLLQVGMAYAVGIALAITVCISTSHGHFNPGITAHAMVFRGFPVLKGIRYITAQIFGAYIACLLVYVQYKDLIHIAVNALIAAGEYDTVMFTAQGPGGIFGFYVSETANLGYVALNEFVCDFIIALVIFVTTEPSNHFASPTSAPWLIALVYGVMIWGFAPVGISANAARDLGGRFAVLTLFGRKASGGSYASIAALMNIPATFVAGAFYDLVLADSNRSLSPEWHQFMSGVAAERARRANGDEVSLGSSRSDEKIAQVDAVSV